MDAGTAAALRARAREVLEGEGAGPAPSPCTSVCRMDPANGLCDGCLRSIDEIAGWGMLPDAQRRAVWRLLEQRAAALA
ncbi:MULTISPECIES: DUF1289 domain-containing protein [unclassified Ramlibacter]|uniref:DUF1289 domain-containing protein n=1 Tax=unclassified Ramlibacter TaxID=2617605 RepID=UPI0036314627